MLPSRSPTIDISENGWLPVGDAVTIACTKQRVGRDDPHDHLLRSHTMILYDTDKMYWMGILYCNEIQQKQSACVKTTQNENQNQIFYYNSNIFNLKQLIPMNVCLQRMPNHIQNFLVKLDIRQIMNHFISEPTPMTHRGKRLLPSNGACTNKFAIDF